VLGVTANDSTLAASEYLMVTVTPENIPPSVSAGTDAIIVIGETLPLSGSASDDGLPNPPAVLITTWTNQSGPGTVTFGNINAPATTAAFSQPGIYVLRLTAYDGDVTLYDEITVGVKESAYASETAFNLTAFVESDPSSKITVTQDCASFNVIQTRNTNAYLFTPHNTIGDFSFEFDTSFTFYESPAGQFLIWGGNSPS
jgi:hypothetical protein